MADTAAPFGYKTAWLAVRNTDQAVVMQALSLFDATPATWDRGLDVAYARGTGLVMVTPAVAAEWTLVAGAWAFPDDAHGVRELGERIAKLSEAVGEVQAFASHRVVEYHHWMLARHGSLIRAFAFIGESGEVLINSGELTPVEQPFGWEDLETFGWTPDESHVMEVAAAWSVDPTRIDTYAIGQGPVLLASTGDKRR